jgi:hypothetical protein
MYFESTIRDRLKLFVERFDYNMELYKKLNNNIRLNLLSLFSLIML